MAFVLADRVKETTTSPGTGTATLNGSAAGYQSFSAGIGANNTTYYTIADQSGSNWEVGFGTVGAGGTTLARTTVLASSNSGSLVNFASGTQDVWCDYPATKATYGLTAGTGISVTPGAGILTVANTGVTSVTGTAPVVSSGGATPAISMAAANTTTNGYLTSTDWNTFNNKGSGTVTAVSVASANGFAGTSSGGATPALTLSTSITGVLKGNGTAISAATAGTDYSAGTSALSTGILKSTTSTGALSIAVAADFPTLNQNTTGSSASCTGNAATATTASKVANALTAGTGISFSSGTTYDGSAAITINSSVTSPIPSGTVMLFYQSAAPTGWTQVTTLNDYDLRLVSGAGGTTGGTTAYSTVFANQTPSYTPSNGTLAASNGTLAVGAGTFAIAATTLSTTQIPAHSHVMNSNWQGPQGGCNGHDQWGSANSGNVQSISTQNSGGGTSHTHSLSGAPSLTGSVSLTGTVGGTVGAVTLNVRYANIIICSKN